MNSTQSDSSGEDDEQYTTTNVTLGYGSKEPTDDAFSQLGGTPTWLDNEPPSSALAKCKTCQSSMSLLLQLNGDLPEYFPGHDRNSYLFACRNKPCRRKSGTMRAIRGIKISPSEAKSKAQATQAAPKDEPARATQPPVNLGSSIFGSNQTYVVNPSGNPFSTTSKQTLNPNPFSSTPAANPVPYGHQRKHFKSLPTANTQEPSASDPADLLSKSFAEQARLSSPTPPSEPSPREPWPSPSLLPKPYASYHLDADYETLDSDPPSSAPASASAQPSAPGMDKEAPASNEDDDPSSWLSSSAKADTTFLRFASRLAQNPEQILRYEFRGQPLLYSKTDDVGKAFPLSSSTSAEAKGSENRIPRCGNCGAKRVFEFQLTPHAISLLEAEEEGMEGMEWGTVVVGVCEKDCGERGVQEGKVGWVEEWVAVSWEENVSGR